jgi:hypothetical protein
MMHPDRIWADGPVRAVVRIGVPAGFVYGMVQFLMTGSALRAALGGAFFAGTFGAFMAWLMRRRWRRSSDLAPDDRVTVARAVRTGEDVQDERLADAIIQYADVVRQAQERDARLNWVLVAFAIMTLIAAIASTAAGSTREAVLFWALTAFWAVNLTWLIPRRNARLIANARRAEIAARSNPSWSGEG